MAYLAAVTVIVAVFDYLPFDRGLGQNQNVSKSGHHVHSDTLCLDPSPFLGRALALFPDPCLFPFPFPGLVRVLGRDHAHGPCYLVPEIYPVLVLVRWVGGR